MPYYATDTPKIIKRYIQHQIPIPHFPIIWYDPSAIKAAYFGVAGTGNTDAGDATKEGLAPLAKLQETYSGIDNEVKKIIARRKGADHAEMLYYGDGYMTAWFLWHLQGDTKAQAAFDEIVKNDKWQDISKNF